MSLKEYQPGTTFTGRMGRTVSESEPAWYGPPINTPNLDRLAQGRLKARQGWQLFVDGTHVGEAEFEVTAPLALGIGGGLTVGRNPGSPVSQLYTTPFTFTGTISTVVVDVSGDADEDESEDKKGHARVAMARL